MCNIAIDFGKHGKTFVPRENLKWVKKVVNIKGYPEFMEKEDRPTRESDGVLGQLYKQVKDKEK